MLEAISLLLMGIRISLIKFGWSRSAWKYFEMFYWPLNALKSIICTNERQKMCVTFMSTIISIIIRLLYSSGHKKMNRENVEKKTYIFLQPFLVLHSAQVSNKIPKKINFFVSQAEWFRYFHIFTKTPPLCRKKKTMNTQSRKTLYYLMRQKENGWHGKQIVGLMNGTTR